MILQLGIDLLQAIACLVIEAGGGSPLTVQTYHTFGLCLDLGMLGLCGFQLHEVVGVVQLCQQLPLGHMLAFLHVHAAQRAGHFEGDIGIGRSHYLARILLRDTLTTHTGFDNLDGGQGLHLTVTAATGTHHAGSQHTTYNIEFHTLYNYCLTLCINCLFISGAKVRDYLYL